MQHLLIEKFDALNKILTRFFEENYHRTSKPTIMRTEEQGVFNLACQIYKRGFIEKFDQSKNVYMLNNSIHDKEKSSHKISSPHMQIHSVEQFKNFLNSQFISQDKKTFFLLDKNFIDYHSEVKNILLQQKVENYFFYLPSESTKDLKTVKNILIHIPEQTDRKSVV